MKTTKIKTAETLRAPTFPDAPVGEGATTLDCVIGRLELLMAFAEETFRNDVMAVRVDGSVELKKSACVAVEVSRMRVERARLAVAMAKGMTGFSLGSKTS